MEAVYADWGLSKHQSKSRIGGTLGNRTGCGIEEMELILCIGCYC